MSFLFIRCLTLWNDYVGRVYRWKCAPCIPECHGWQARPVLSRTVPLTASKPLASQHPSEDISQSLEEENEKSEKSKEKKGAWGDNGNRKGGRKYWEFSHIHVDVVRAFDHRVAALNLSIVDSDIVIKIKRNNIENFQLVLTYKKKSNFRFTRIYLIRINFFN